MEWTKNTIKVEESRGTKLGGPNCFQLVGVQFNYFRSNLTILGSIAPHMLHSKSIGISKAICMPRVVNFASIDALVIVMKTVSYWEERNK